LHHLEVIAKYIIVIIACSIFFSSCLKDPCNGVFCYEGGECINGTCLCENNYLGLTCENSYAEYFAGNYVVFDSLNEPDDTIRLSVLNSSTDSLSFSDYDNLSPEQNVLSTVKNDSTINIFNQEVSYFDSDTIEQLIDVSGTILGKPTDTMQLMSSYGNSVSEYLYNKKILKITN